MTARRAGAALALADALFVREARGIRWRPLRRRRRAARV